MTETRTQAGNVAQGLLGGGESKLKSEGDYGDCKTDGRRMAEQICAQTSEDAGRAEEKMEKWEDMKRKGNLVHAR